VPAELHAIGEPGEREAADSAPVPRKNFPPTIRRESRMRWTSTRSLWRSAACLNRRLSSISRRRWNKVSAHVDAITKPRKQTPYVRSGLSTEPATSIRNASRCICCQSRATRRLNALTTTSQVKNCAPTPMKSPLTIAVRRQYASANTLAAVHIHAHFSNRIRGGSHHHETTSATKPPSAIAGGRPPPAAIARYANATMR
jgi:hypothetical protein